MRLEKDALTAQIRDLGDLMEGIAAGRPLAMAKALDLMMAWRVEGLPRPSLRITTETVTQTRECYKDASGRYAMRDLEEPRHSEQYEAVLVIDHVPGTTRASGFQGTGATSWEALQALAAQFVGHAFTCARRSRNAAEGGNDGS